MLVTIRDRGLPLPAGGILISPWVDLTHSFPSIVTDNPGDYIPPNGFRYRPSETWPPPSVDDIATMKSHGKAASGEQAVDAGGVAKSESIIVKLDGQTIEVKDQIQMYATNQLVSHPLVSPVLQPSLGGLPPLFVLVGGGEMLRDEQFYLAHKAANPMSYAPSDALLDEHDPDREILRKYEPTYVQLQIWENMCHVAPMLSFAPPVKHMYRAIAQFGAWALARAQSTEIDILDDDGVSPIPSDVDTPRPVAKTPKRQSTLEPTSVGRAGDPLPPFFKHMIRQRVDDHGNIFPLDPPSSYRVLQIPRSQVGAINPVLVKRWVDSQKEWDEKFARDKARMKRQRVKELVQGLSDFNGESPPPSSLAARRAAPGVLRRAGGKKNYPLLLWSRLASRHDGRTIGREDKAVSSRRTSVDAKKSGAIDGTAAGRLEPTENGVDRTLSGSDEKRGEAQEDTAAGEEAGQPSNQPHEVTTPKISVDKPMSPLLVLPDDEDVKESMDEKASTRALFHARGTLPMNSQASLGHSSRPTAWTLRSQSDDVSTIGDKDSLTPAYSPKVSIDKPMSPLLVLPDDDEVKQSFDEKASTRALFHAPGTLPMTSQISLAHSNRPATIRSPSDDGSTIGEKANSALDTASTRAVHDSAGVIGLIDRPDSGATGRTMDNASTRAVLDSTGVVGLVDRPGTPASSGGLGNTEFVIPKGVIETDTEQQISRPHMPDREVFKTSLEYPEA